MFAKYPRGNRAWDPSASVQRLSNVVPFTRGCVPGAVEGRPTEYGDGEISSLLGLKSFCLKQDLVKPCLFAIGMELLPLGCILGDGNWLGAGDAFPGSLPRLVDMIGADTDVALDALAERPDNRLDVLVVRGNHVDDQIGLYRGHLLLEVLEIAPVAMEPLGSSREGDVVLPSVVADYRMPPLQ